jgi:hypothetical protein
MAVGPDEQNTEFAGYCAAKAVCTDAVNEQLCPPIVKAKLAVPLLAGVPEIAKESEPAPLAKVPEVSVAVNPVTPVDEMFCAAYEPPFPPVYGTEALTLLAAVPLVKVPVIDVEPQLMAPSVAGMADASLMQRTAKP